MRAGMRFFTAMLRMSLRNRQGLFWTLFFPVMFMLATGLIGGTAPTLDVAVVAGAPDPACASLVETLREVPGVAVATFDDSGQAEAKLVAGDLDAVIVLPPGFGAAVEAAARGGEPVVVEVMYRKNDPMVAGPSPGSSPVRFGSSASPSPGRTYPYARSSPPSVRSRRPTSSSSYPDWSGS